MTQRAKYDKSGTGRPPSEVDQLKARVAELESQLEEARWLLKDPPIPFPYKDDENSEWYDRRDAWLSAHTPTGKDKL